MFVCGTQLEEELELKRQSEVDALTEAVTEKEANIAHLTDQVASPRDLGRKLQYCWDLADLCFPGSNQYKCLIPQTMSLGYNNAVASHK